MITYFADRMTNVLGFASTKRSSKYMIVDDIKVEDSETGIGTLELTVAFSDENRLELEEMLKAGSCILREATEGRSSLDKYVIDSSSDFFTITETEVSAKDKTIYTYAEDAGLDLINDLAPKKTYTSAVGIETYINDFASASGFTVRVNEIPNETRKLTFDSETTVAARLQEIAQSFECDLSFAFEVQGLAVTNRYIDITHKDGNATDVVLYMDKDISDIRVKKSVNNLATALHATGKDGLTLAGYTYDDGDFYVNGEHLHSRQAVENWRRYAWSAESSEDIYRTFSCDATTQVALCEATIEELKKLREPEVNYEVELRHLETPVSIRDRISVVDDKGNLYLSAKVLQIEASATRGLHNAVLGDYLIRDSGISERVEELAAKFAEIADTRVFYTWTAYADDASGTGISLNPAGKAYLGIASNRLVEEVDISDPTVFKWSKIEGEKGAKGDPGTPGQKGDPGQDADIWTIGSDGYWYKNGVKQSTKAQGSDADVWTIGADNYWYLNGVKTDKKAKGDTGTGVSATYRYYWLGATTPTIDSATVRPPKTGGVAWTLAEPSYMVGSTNNLYFVDCTVFSNNAISYGEISKSSSYEAAKAAYIKAQDAQNDIDSLDVDVRGERTYEYLLNGVPVPVYKRVDGPYYYILNDEEVTVAEADLVHEDGELKEYRASGLEGAVGLIEDTLTTIGERADEFELKDQQLEASIAANSLLARKNARLQNQSLIITSDTEANITDLENFLQCNPDSVVIYSDKKSVVTIASVSGAGYLRLSGTSLLIAQESKFSTIRIRSAEGVGTFGWVAGSDGKVSLKEVL